MSLRMFQALPAYFGGKRRLVGEIFKRLPPSSRAPVFLDAFLGGGAVSLYAKARGYKVFCNDIAERSFIVGKSLIENSRVKITKKDILRLFMKNGNGRQGTVHFIEDHFVPRFIEKKHAEFLDNAFLNLNLFEGTKRHLMKFLLVKYIFLMMPWSQFTATSFWESINTKDYDRVKRQYISRNFRILNKPIKVALEDCADFINSAIFGNGKENRAYQMDVFEFLKEAEGDIIYFDPPYYGTLSYEKELARIDQILARNLNSTLPVSAFSSEGALKAVERLFEMTAHIPRTVLSFGNARVTLEELVGIIRRHRKKVESHEIKYRHCENRASREKNEENREFIIIAQNA